MESTEQSTQEPAQEPAHGQEVSASTNGDGPSIFDGIRAMREQRVGEEARQIDLDVPGYEDRLAVIYRYPEDGYRRVVKAVERETDPEPDARLDSAADVLVACCAAVVGRDAEGKLVDPVTNEPIADGQLPESPMRFNMRLAEAMEIDVPDEVTAKGRYIARQVFSPRGQSLGIYEGDLALISTSNIIFGWLNGAEVKIDEDVAGE